MDPAAPAALTPREEELVAELVRAFPQSERLQRHVRYLYARGAVYKVTNGNLLFHGAVPMTADGDFARETFEGQAYSGRALFDYCDRRARAGYFAPPGSAARLAGLTELPVQLKELEDQGVLEVALIENLQREDLNPMEQAGGYRRLMEEFSLTQEEVAARVGRSRPAVANTLRLLSLPKTIQDMVQEGALSEGHGRALVGLDESVSLPLALQACEQGLSVRQLERLASAAAKAGREGESPAPEPAKDLYARQLGEALSGRLGRRVQLRPGAKKGRIEIEYYDNQDLCALLEQLGLPVEL